MFKRASVWRFGNDVLAPLTLLSRISQAVDFGDTTGVNSALMSSKTKKQTWESELRESQLVLSENIRKLRGQRGLSQERLALEADVDRTLVSKIERVIANPSLGILVKLAVALDVPLLHLLREQQKS